MNKQLLKISSRWHKDDKRCEMHEHETLYMITDSPSPSFVVALIFSGSQRWNTWFPHSSRWQRPSDPHEACTCSVCAHRVSCWRFWWWFQDQRRRWITPTVHLFSFQNIRKRVHDALPPFVLQAAMLSFGFLRRQYMHHVWRFSQTSSRGEGWVEIHAEITAGR